MIYILLVFLLVVSLIQLFYFKDIFQPSILVTISYIISVSSAIFNDNRWHIRLTYKTFFIIIIAILVFWISDVICTIITNKRRLKSESDIEKEIIKIESWKLKIVIIYDIIVILLYIVEIRSIAISGGWSGGLDTLMSYYRSVSYSSASMGDNVNIIVSQMVKLMSCFRLIFIYIYINNSIIEKTYKKYWKYLIPVVLSILQTLFAAQRMALIMTAIFGLFIWYSSYHKLIGWNKSINKKLIKNCIKYMIIIFILFFLLKSFVGRTTTLGFFSYITSYTGGSIDLLNQYLLNPQVVKLPGEETFASLYTFLAKFGLIENSVRHLEFRLYDTTGVNREVGNVYTALRRYYNDFGYMGVVVLNLIMGICYSYMFNRIRTIKKKRDYSNFRIIIYGNMMYALIMHAIDDIFFSEMISVGFLVQIILLKLTYMFIVNIRVKI